MRGYIVKVTGQKNETTVRMKREDALRVGLDLGPLANDVSKANVRRFMEDEDPKYVCFLVKVTPSDPLFVNWVFNETVTITATEVL